MKLGCPGGVWIPVMVIVLIIREYITSSFLIARTARGRNNPRLRSITPLIPPSSLPNSRNISRVVLEKTTFLFHLTISYNDWTFSCTAYFLGGTEPCPEVFMLCVSFSQRERLKVVEMVNTFLLGSFASSCITAIPLLSIAPRPQTCPSAMVPENGG